ncbi:MAG: universal stress protein [Thermoproteota archaeon]|nr:universal stress protein [Thermoproteota archaeon]
MLFKKILVPYDNSKPSHDALEKAIEVTKSMDKSRLFILHVVPELPLPYLFDRPVRNKAGKRTTMVDYFKQVHDELRTNAKMKLQHIEEKCEKEGIDTEIHILSGSPARTIIEFAREKGIDLIIISSRDSTPSERGKSRRRGRRIMRTVLPGSLGSVSRAVAESAPCPILLIRA